MDWTPNPPIRCPSRCNDGLLSTWTLGITEAHPSHLPLGERALLPHHLPPQTYSSSSHSTSCSSLHSDLGHILFFWRLSPWGLHTIPSACGWILDLKILSNVSKRFHQCRRLMEAIVLVRSRGSTPRAGDYKPASVLSHSSSYCAGCPKDS